MKNYGEIIEQYLNGELDQAEKEWFEKKLANDPEFEAEYILRAQINEAIMEKDVLELRAKLNQVYQNANKPTTKVRKLYFGAFQMVAASLVVLFMVGALIITYINPPSNPEELYTKFYEPDELVMKVRSSESSMSAEIVTGMEALKAGNYDQAIKQFNSLESNNMAKYYLGIAYMETEQYALAKNQFNLIVSDNNSLFVEQSEWYLGLCYLALDKTKEAKKVFTNIKNSDNLRAKEAEKILEDIE